MTDTNTSTPVPTPPPPSGISTGTAAGAIGLIVGAISKIAGASWAGVAGLGISGIGGFFLWNFIIKFLNARADTRDEKNASTDAANTAIDIKNQADAAQTSLDDIHRQSPPVAPPKAPDAPPTIPVTTPAQLPDMPAGTLSIPDNIVAGKKFEITYSGQGIENSHLIVYAERSHFVSTLEWDNTRNLCAGFGSISEVRDGSRVLGIKFPGGWLEKKIAIKA